MCACVYANELGSEKVHGSEGEKVHGSGGEMVYGSGVCAQESMSPHCLDV